MRTSSCRCCCCRCRRRSANVRCSPHWISSARRIACAIGLGHYWADSCTTWLKQFHQREHAIMSEFQQRLDAVRTLHVAYATIVGLLLVAAFVYRKQLRFIVKSLARNKLRSVLTSIATIVLVFIVTLIW